MKRASVAHRTLAGLVIAIGIITPLAMYFGAAADTPQIRFEGVELNTMADGSVQAIFSVGIKNLDNVAGCGFSLDYNGTYMTPSNFETNVPLENNAGVQGAISDDAFFRVDGDFYGVEDDDHNPVNPFEKTKWNQFYSQWFANENWISMNLTVRGDLEPSGNFEHLLVGFGKEPYNVFHTGESGDPKNEEVVMGYLSFRVEPEFLPQVAQKFGSVTETANPLVGSDYLIKIGSKTSTIVLEPWNITFISDGEVLNCTERGGELDGQAIYDFQFPQKIISLEATERVATVDAYQAYTDGTVDDVARTLRKFSPMATATYTDGSKAHLVMPWGSGEAAAEYKVYRYGTDTYDADGVYTGGAEVGADPLALYDPTGNVQGGKTPDYVIQQYYYYQDGVDDAGDPVYVRYPLPPVTVKLVVTPITLTGVWAEDLHKTYLLNDALLDSVEKVQDLKLPRQARLRTDVPVDGASLLLDIPGWTTMNTASTWPTSSETMSGLLADGAAAGGNHWPTKADQGKWDGPDSVADQREGIYSFHTADADGGAAQGFERTDIQAAYPWLTVPGNSYALEDATRTLVKQDGLIEAGMYSVTYVSTGSDAYGPVLTLRVMRANEDNMNVTNPSRFRVLLPDGTKLGTGETNTDAVGWPDWMGPPDGDPVNHSAYEAQAAKGGDTMTKDLYHLVVAPGDTASEDMDTNADREHLRRFINLGGWFYVSVNEDPGTLAWTDYIPVYVPPRGNLHTEDKEYNFVGDNAALFQYPGKIGTTVTVPQGEYIPLDQDGNLAPGYTNDAGLPLYIDNKTGMEVTSSKDADGNANRRKMARFGAATTYNGMTGAQPGALHTFRVKGTAAWGPTTQGATFQYGPDQFVDGAVYAAYGTVGNGENKRATLRTGATEQPGQTESVTLTYQGAGNVVSDPATGNVTLAVYDSQTVGYTTRQDYTFTVTNTGDTTIYDLGVDTWTDDDGDGGHYEMLKPPASFLAPGQSTTFTLTYVYNLDSGPTSKEYLDTLFLTSSAHPRGGQDGDYLLDFDAKFEVSHGELYKVTIVYDPADGAMGTSETIFGEYQDSTDSLYKMDYTPTSNTYTANSGVHLVVRPTDEYTVKEITYTYPSGTNPQYVPTTYAGGDGTNDGSLPGSAALEEGTGVYYFTMPADDVVVHIEFEEGLLSKLRLSDLKVYADKTEAAVDPVATPAPADREPYRQRVFQKTFTDAERDKADDLFDDDNTRLKDEYLMQMGSALKNEFDSTVNQYLVVVPYEAEYAQVEAILRQVVLPLDNPANIKPDVAMTLFESDGSTKSSLQVKLSTDGGFTLTVSKGDTAVPTVHQSQVFPSPEAGKSKYVDIQISFNDGSAVGTQTRHYYVEIHRETQELSAVLNYGNSPAGMIWNAANIIGTDNKGKALDAFVANRYSFGGMDAGLIPVKATNELQAVHYWPEAWVKAADARYELESAPDATEAVRSQYDPAKNMDLDKYALFVYSSGNQTAFTEPGIARKDGVDQVWDSSGRPVKAEDVMRYAEVQVLDTAADISQQKRFDVPEADAAVRTVRIPLGTADKHSLAAGWATVPVQERNADGSLKFDAKGYPVYVQKKDESGNPVFVNGTEPVYETETVFIRPGVYKLVYLFQDYDGSLPVKADGSGTWDQARLARFPSRPLVILAPAGDVDANGTVDKTADVALIKGRATNPLGYEPYDAAARTYDANHYLDRWVFRYRVCDVNNDRNINNIDANELRSRAALIQYYLPTDYGFTPPTA